MLEPYGRGGHERVGVVSEGDHVAAARGGLLGDGGNRQCPVTLANGDPRAKRAANRGGNVYTASWLAAAVPAR